MTDHVCQGIEKVIQPFAYNGAYMRYDQLSGVPLYVRTREKIRAELSQMEQGEAIPTEAELEKKFGVSRITIRRAVENLVAEGLLLRQQGRGTFVQKSKLTHELNFITSWTEQLRRMGFSPTTSKIRITRELPMDHIAHALRLAPGEEIIRVERVRLANREPISYMLNYFPARLVPDFANKAAKVESFYELLEKEYNLVPVMAVDTVGTRQASDREAKFLRVEPESPVLSVRRVTYLAGGVPLELALVASRGDRYQYQVTVHGRPRVESPELLERVLEDASLIYQT